MKERILKRKLYLVLSILTIVTILSSAAICNLGKNLTEGVLGDIAEDINQGIGSSDDSEKDSTNKGNSSDSNSSDSNSSDSNSSDSNSSDSNSSDSNSSDSNSSDSNSSDSNSSGNKDSKDSKSSSNSQNSSPVINSMDLNSNEFFPNLQYTFTCDVADPDNDTIYYEWHVDAGTLDNYEAATVTWTAPGSNGIYDIKLKVTDGWGGNDSVTKTVAVGNVPKNAPPVIQGIAVYPDGSKYTDNTYKIWCYNTDPNNSKHNIDFNITGGNLHDQDANTIEWDTPNAPGTYTVTVTITDIEGYIVTSSKNIVVEQHRIEVADIIVINNYIATNMLCDITAVMVDPKLQIASYEWSCSGGQIAGETGFTGQWQTPSNPGTYSLTMTATTLGGDITATKTKEFVVNPPK